jgi:stress response protein YsnF
MEVYEEVPEFHKEAFVCEEVRVSKVVDQETVTAEETLRREELNVDTEGRPVVKNSI